MFGYKCVIHALTQANATGKHTNKQINKYHTKKIYKLSNQNIVSCYIYSDKWCLIVCTVWIYRLADIPTSMVSGVGVKFYYAKFFNSLIHLCISLVYEKKSLH